MYELVQNATKVKDVKDYLPFHFLRVAERVLNFKLVGDVVGAASRMSGVVKLSSSVLPLPLLHTQICASWKNRYNLVARCTMAYTEEKQAECAHLFVQHR